MPKASSCSELNKRRFLGLLSVALFGLLIYSNILNAPFILDDYPTIVENEKIKSLLDALSNIKADRYLTMVSFSFNYAIGMFGTSIPINMLKSYRIPLK